MNNKLLGPLFLLKYISKSLGFPSFFEEGADDVIRGIQSKKKLILLDLP